MVTLVWEVALADREELQLCRGCNVHNALHSAVQATLLLLVLVQPHLLGGFISDGCAETNSG